MLSNKQRNLSKISGKTYYKCSFCSIYFYNVNIDKTKAFASRMKLGLQILLGFFANTSFHISVREYGRVVRDMRLVLGQHTSL